MTSDNTGGAGGKQACPDTYVHTLALASRLEKANSMYSYNTSTKEKREGIFFSRQKA